MSLASWAQALTIRLCHLNECQALPAFWGEAEAGGKKGTKPQTLGEKGDGKPDTRGTGLGVT